MELNRCCSDAGSIAMLSNKQFSGRATAQRAAFSRSSRVSVRAVAQTTIPKASTTAAVTPEVAKDLYYDMVLGREFEDM